MSIILVFFLIIFSLLYDKLAQNQWLKTTHIFNLSFCESGPRVWTSFQNLKKLQPRCLLGSGCIPRLTQGRVHFPAGAALGRIQTSLTVTLRAPVSCWMSAGGCPQFLEAVLSSLPQGSPQSQQGRKSTGKTEDVIIRNIIMKVNSTPLLHAAGWNCHVPRPPSQRDHTEARILGGGHHRCHLRVCPPSTVEWINKTWNITRWTSTAKRMCNLDLMQQHG